VKWNKTTSAAEEAVFFRDQGSGIRYQGLGILDMFFEILKLTCLVKGEG